MDLGNPEDYAQANQDFERMRTQFLPEKWDNNIRCIKNYLIHKNKMMESDADKLRLNLSQGAT
jgi:hypothetical protein